MPTPLYKKHAPSLGTTYADIENYALHQDDPLVGTPGSITIRENANKTKYYVRQFYDFQGKKRDQYICQVGATNAATTINAWKIRIAELKDIQTSIRLLAREGYSTLDPKHLAALAPLVKHQVFQAGAVLIGTHAFEVIVNRLGIRAAAFATEDVDIARLNKLAISNAPPAGLLGLLRESGIDFVDVPGLDRRTPPTSFKEKGRSKFTFDLLVPTSGDEIDVHPVPELNAHATALPYLRYLLTETQTGAAISTHGAIPVNVPVPEKFAIHKLIVAQLRVGRPQKTQKDLHQAAVLIAALGEMHPGALESAYSKAATSRRGQIRKSVLAVEAQLRSHPQAWEEIATVTRVKELSKHP